MAGDEVVEYLQKLIADYEAEISRLRQHVQDLENTLTRERMAAVADEYRLGFLDSEVKALLEGKADVTKQAALITLSWDERYGTIINAAKHLKSSRVPWGMFALAVLMAGILAPLAYFLSIPENFRTLVMWLSVWTNQVFLLVLAVIGLGMAYLIVRRRRSGGGR